MPDQPTPADLPETWRSLATQQWRFGADAQTRILEFCADELTAALLRRELSCWGSPAPQRNPATIPTT
ncbi:MAG TPA: hypothetical protein VJU82_07950 [Acidobacteriaceae bacterium]|nr:hypothetical protein [Acidobacteriaceae bacterium]